MKNMEVGSHPFGALGDAAQGRKEIKEGSGHQFKHRAGSQKKKGEGAPAFKVLMKESLEEE